MTKNHPKQRSGKDQTKYFQLLSQQLPSMERENPVTLKVLMHWEMGGAHIHKIPIAVNQ
jgi:hypothetical protein